MIIAINTRVLSGNTAIRKSLLECFEDIAAQQPQHEFIFISESFFDQRQSSFSNIKKIVLPQQSKNPLLWKLWYNYTLPSALKKYKADVLVNADGVCCLRTNIPQCLLMNDLDFLHHPEFYANNYLRFIKANTASFLHKSVKVIAASNVLSTAIQKQYNIDQAKIATVYAGANSTYQPIHWQQREAIKEQYAEGKEYFLFNGSIHQRSSLVNLLKGFSLFKKRQKSNMQLVIASTENTSDTAFMESLQSYKYRNEIKVLQSISNDELQHLVAAAYGCINLSPLHSDIACLLNAMQSGVPVIAGNLYVAIELFNDAALFAHATEPTDIAEKLMQLYKDEDGRNTLIENGIAQAKQFNTQATALQIWQNIQAVM